MARKQTQVREVQDFVVGQLEDARKRVVKIEKELVAKGREQQRELERLIDRVRSGRELKAWEKKAKGAQAKVQKQLDRLSGQLVSGLGLATRSDLKKVQGELGKLSKKVDAIARRVVGETGVGRSVN